MNENDIALILDTLDHDGATYETDDGRTITLSIEQDPDTQVNDYECYGETSKYAYDYWRDGKTARPSHFDGNAEKIEVDRGLWVWWQPPRGEMAWIDPETGKPARRGSAVFEKNRSDIIDLLRCGFSVVSIRVDHECGECGHTHEADGASVGGVDSIDNGYLRELVTDLLAEVGIDGTT